MNKQFIYISIENANREILPKLLVVKEALKNNFNIVIGNRHVLFSLIDYLPKGALLEKSLHYKTEPFFKKISKIGFSLYVLDEEALTIASITQYMKLNYYKGNEKYLNTFFLSNLKQKEMLMSSKVDKSKLYLTGTPKFEIYKKKYRNIFLEETNKIKIKYKKYILVTSRFAHINPNLPKLNDVDKLDKTYLFTSEKIYKKFIKLTIDLSKRFKSMDIIYRPHPSENINKAKSFFKNYNNVKVVYDGNVAPWILGSTLIIHNRCTTGLEGLLLKKPVISFDPINYKSIHSKFFEILGFRCNTSQKVINMAEKIIEKKKPFNKYNNKILKKYIYKFNTNQPHKKIVNFIKKNSKIEKLSLSIFTKLLLLIIGIKKSIIFNIKLFFNQKRAFYQYQKFGKINLTLLKKNMALINAYNVRNKEAIKIKTLSWQLFLITRK